MQNFNWMCVLKNTLLTVWTGGMFTSGYIVAPILFTKLADRTLAGTLAGAVFHAMGIVGLFCGSGILMLMAMQWRMLSWRQWRCWLVAGMLAMTAIGLFYLQPAIEVLRDSGEAARGSPAFKNLHGASSILLLLTCVGGFVLVVRGIQPRTEAV